MTIQINTDKNIDNNERLDKYLKSLINEELERFGDDITRIELHLSDENAGKDGVNDKRCLIEARLSNKKPVAVTSNANTIEKAVNDALGKIKSMLSKK